MLDYEELLAFASRDGRRGSANGILSKLKEKVRERLADVSSRCLVFYLKLSSKTRTILAHGLVQCWLDKRILVLNPQETRESNTSGAQNLFKI